MNDVIKERAAVGLAVLAGLAFVGVLIGRATNPTAVVFFVLSALAVAATAAAMIRAVRSVVGRDEDIDSVRPTEEDERTPLAMEKSLALQALKELESDRAVGKVDERDYQALKTSTEARALAAMRRMKEIEEHWLEEAERLIEKRVGTRRPARQEKPAFDEVAFEGGVDGKLVCTHCRTPNDADALFCIECGKKRQIADRKMAP